MIGYHYTTSVIHTKIVEEGLQLQPLEERHQREFAELLPFIQNGCIWVYPKQFQTLELIGILFYVAERHRDWEIRCLEVEYDDNQSVRQVVLSDEDVSKCLLTHTLELGIFSHYRVPFDLITKSIESSSIRLVGSWNLFDLIEERLKR